MYKILFYSRWAAALWATATLISIATFVAEGGGHEEIDKLAKELAAEQKASTQMDGRSLLIDDSDEESAPRDTAKAAGEGSEGEDADDADTYVIINKSAPANQSSDEDLVDGTGAPAGGDAM